MKPIFQTIFTPPHGNCMQASIASILELPLSKVPNFMEDGDEWEKTLDEYLTACHDFRLLTLKAEWIDGLEPSLTRHLLFGHYLMVGTSPSGDWDHVVCGHQGAMSHDPHPDGNGLKKLTHYEFFIKLFQDNFGSKGEK